MASLFGRKSRVTAADPAPPPLKSPASASLEAILLPGAKSRWTLPTVASMTPAALQSLLTEALTGRSPRREHELYQLMESTWPRLKKNMAEVKNAVISQDWSVCDTDDNPMPGMADLLKRAKNGMRGDPTIDGMGWRATCSALLDAWFYGVGVVQVIWERRGGGTMPLAMLPQQGLEVSSWHYGWRPGPWGAQSAINSEQDGRLVLYPDAQPGTGVEFPRHKFLIAIHKTAKGHPSGGALLRPLAWWWCASNFSSEWLLNFAQVFGQPYRWATYPQGNDAAKAALANMMENMGSMSWGVGPDGTKVEFVETGSRTGENPQERVMDRADTAADLLILGQTLTTSQGQSGSRALGDVHASVRADVIDAAAQWLAEVLNEQLVPSIAELNYGDPGEEGRLPWYEPQRKQVRDQKVLAEVIKLLKEAGMEIPLDWAHEALDIPMPKSGQKILGAMQSAEAPPDTGAVSAETRQELQRVMAGLPVDSREYFLARLGRIMS